ncbi:hypothetical protein PO124_20400 [Bacillus licheniformis]|nr:hypothetical protein [Bacillus licheniformis]
MLLFINSLFGLLFGAGSVRSCRVAFENSSPKNGRHQKTWYLLYVIGAVIYWTHDPQSISQTRFIT